MLCGSDGQIEFRNRFQFSGGGALGLSGSPATALRLVRPGECGGTNPVRMRLWIRAADGSTSAVFVKTADAAAACGCEIDQIVKSIVFKQVGSDRHVLFLTAGGNRVDPGRASAVSGAPLEKADAAGVRAHTGFAIGGVSPLGQLTPIEAWFDPALLRFPLVWAAAGTPNHVFAVDPAALVAATGATVVDFTA